MDNYEVKGYPQSFWMNIADVFQREARNSYSWRSCRNRIASLVSNRLAYWECVREGYPRVSRPLGVDIEKKIDWWIHDCDAKVEESRKLDQQARDEQAAALRENERRVYEEKRQRTIKRVQAWADNVPPPDKVQPLPLHFGMPPDLSDHKYRPSRSPRVASRSLSRSRSQSPRGINDSLDYPMNYRQRPDFEITPKSREYNRINCEDFERYNCQRNDANPAHEDVTVQNKRDLSPGSLTELEEKMYHEALAAPSDPIQPVKDYDATGSRAAEGEHSINPCTKTANNDATKEAIAYYGKRIDALAENQAKQNQGIRQSLQEFKSDFHSLSQMVKVLVMKILFDDSK